MNHYHNYYSEITWVQVWFSWYPRYSINHNRSFYSV